MSVHLLVHKQGTLPNHISWFHARCCWRELQIILRPDRCAFHGIMDRWQAQEQRRLDRASNNPAECHKLRDIRATGFAMRLRLLPVIILCAMANATSGPAISAACSDGMYCGRNLQLCGAHAVSDGWHLTRAGDAVVMRIDTTSCMALGQRKSKDVRYVASIEARPPYRSQRMYLSLQDGTLKSLPSFEQHKAGNGACCK